MPELIQGEVSMNVASSPAVSLEEVRLAARNHGQPLEMIREDITPVGLHYLLIHFDIPAVDLATWRLAVDGAVREPLELTLDDVRARPSRTLPVTLECAGNGRALFEPHVVSQPWMNEAVGTAEWTGTPLAPLLDEAGVAASACEIVFTGLDRGIQADVEQSYQRSLTLDEARSEDVLLAYEINGVPLPPQHGYPLRVIVPGWYGMTHVKWLRSITAVEEPFEGWQQAVAYHVRSSDDDPGRPVTRIEPRSLIVPPGIPDFLSRDRFLDPGPCPVRGRAWSGWAPIARVEVSVDGGASWADAELDAPLGEWAWRGWRYAWEAEPGEHELCSRATDAAGNVQPLQAEWNVEGCCNNSVQSVRVTVRR
jgi:DMSO/TMAO reductase YedYZ molybdopterin-dependent catalytic subunit